MKASLEERWKPETLFHAYVLRCYLNVRWDLTTMFDGEIEDTVRLYLSNTINNEYDKGKVLNIINGSTRKNIREKARFAFPDMFNIPETYPISVPKRLKDKFGEDYVNFVQQLKNSRKETEMSEVTQEAVQSQVNVDLDSLTVENFQQVLGRRFRVTKEQKERGISRELALEEWKRAIRAGTITL